MVSAPDIITYVGVPLAVLGVLPIFYTCLRSIIALRSIRHVLRHNGLSDSAVTRGSLMSGIVEVEIPRRRIAPLDRDLDPAYWTVNSHQISLPGGTWAIFSWNQILTGRTLYRCQYKEELRVPPAEIGFEELVSFLLDRGAVPDARGWKVLRSIGLWTPTGTILLRAPVGDGGSPVLKLAPPYDGDGVLRLALAWDRRWDLRSVDSLPPFWMRLTRPVWNPKEGRDEAKELMTMGDSELFDGTEMQSQPQPQAQQQQEEEEGESESRNEDDRNAGTTTPTIPSLILGIEEMHSSLRNRMSSDAFRFRAEDGLVRSIHFEQHGALTGDSQFLWSATESTSKWFVCIASALSQRSDSGLWNVAIPAEIVTFVKGSIPGGVMVLLGILEEGEVPPFSEPPPDLQLDIMAHHRNFVASQNQRALENLMPPAQAEEARRQRMLAESQSFHDRHLQKLKARREYEERRVIGALNSQPLTIAVVAEKSRLYLVRTKVIPVEYTMDQLAKAILYLMVVNRDEANVITDILDQWLAWSQRGGMNAQHLELLRTNTITFCYASILLAVVERSGRSDSQSSSDMMECLRIWQTVHVG